MAKYEEVAGNIVRDFAERTLSNLEFVEKCEVCKDVFNTDLFEVTQLINSLAWVIDFPAARILGQDQDYPIG